MRIIVDLDEVIVDLMGPLLKEYNRRYKADILIEDITQWNLLTKDMCDIFKEPNFFLELIPLPGAIFGVNELINQGHEVVIASSPSRHPGIAKDKLAWCSLWLQRAELVLTERKDILDGDMIIDDAIHHLENFNGLQVVMDRPWNREYYADYRVEDWNGILRTVKEVTTRPGRG